MDFKHVYLLLFSVVIAAPVMAKTRDGHPSESTLKGHVRWGACALDLDPEVAKISDIWPALCLRPRVTGQILIREDDGSENRLLNFAHLYAGLHLHEYLSFHGNWERKRLFRLSPKAGEALYQDDKSAQNVFLQLGNVATNNFRLAAGHMRIPFGVNHKPLMEIYDETLKTDRYWQTPKWGAKLTYDSQISSSYDIGYASEVIPWRKSEEKNEEAEVPDNRALSVRMMFDIAALEGFRFVLSGYGESLGERRMGVGFVTLNDKGDNGAFEWIRIQTTPDGKDAPFDQLFRLSYSSAYYSGTRSVVEYEDARFKYRIGTLGADLKLPDYGLFRVSISYHDEVLDNKQDFWAIASGMQLSL